MSRALTDIHGIFSVLSQPLSLSLSPSRVSIRCMKIPFALCGETVGTTNCGGGWHSWLEVRLLSMTDGARERESERVRSMDRIGRGTEEELGGRSHMTSAKFWDFWIPFTHCHCPTHATYQYYHLLEQTPLPPQRRRHM